jgi:effector-binding domain-containing protein
MDKLYENSETGCCTRFNPQPWDKKEVTFKDKLFIKDHVTSFLHIPLNFKGVMIRNMEMIAKAGALAPVPMVLSDENSLWGADIYIAVSKDVPVAEMVKLSGDFLSQVFEGPYKNIRQWIKQMSDYVRRQGKELKKLYFFYTTCPKCAKYYGKNYVVLLAQI